MVVVMGVILVLLVVLGIEFIPRLMGAHARCGASGVYVKPIEGEYAPTSDGTDVQRILKINEATLTLVKFDNYIQSLPFAHEPDLNSGTLGAHDHNGQSVTIMATDKNNVVRVDNGRTCTVYQLVEDDNEPTFQDFW
jgi:hypothetical protein